MAEMQNLRSIADLDLEQSASGSDNEASALTGASTSTPRRLGLGLLGAACLAACAVAALLSASRSSPPAGRVTIRELLEGDDMVKVATHNTMSLWGIKAEKRDEVRAFVTKGLQHITSEYSKEPWFQQRSDRTISSKQKDAVLNVVAHMSDPRVHKVGHDLAKAVQGAHGREEAKQRVLQAFGSDKLTELRQLHDEIYAGIRKVAKKDSPVTFHPEQMRLVQGFPDDLPELDLKSLKARRLSGSMLTSSDLNSAGDTGMTALEFLASFCDEARIVLDNVDFLGDASGQDMKIPSEAKSFVGGVDFFAQLADCLNRAGGNEVKEGMCPMKYSSAAFDMISCLDNELGLANEDGGLEEKGSIFEDLMTAMGWSDETTTSSASTRSSSSGLSGLFGSSSTPTQAPAAANAWKWN